MILTLAFLRTEKGYPLVIEADSILVEKPSTVDTEMLIRLLPKLEYSAVLQAVSQVSSLCEKEGVSLPTLPEALPDEELDPTTHATLLADLHRILFDIHIQEGNLVCPDTGRKFPVKEGIPNMVLHEDEI